MDTDDVMPTEELDDARDAAWVAERADAWIAEQAELIAREEGFAD